MTEDETQVPFVATDDGDNPVDKNKICPICRCSFSQDKRGQKW